MLKALRPEFDIFMVTDAPVEDVVGKHSIIFAACSICRRMIARCAERAQGLREQLNTIFNALQRYSQKPRDVSRAALFPFGDNNQIAMDSDLANFMAITF